MTRQILALAFLIGFVVGCQPARDVTGSADDPDDPLSHLPLEVREGLERYLAQRDTNLSDHSFLNCEEYLTEVKSEDYCSSEVPDTWVPFEFDGETYFIHPLTSAKQ